MKSESGRMKSEMLNGSVPKEFALNIIALYPSYRKEERPKSSVTSY